MNCAECRDNLVACLEGLLDAEQSRQCQAHLETCAACRAEYAATTRLQQLLVASGRVAANVSLVEPVMRQVHRTQTQPERITFMSKLLQYRWGFGLSAAAGAAIIVLITLLAMPGTHATAAQVMAKGAQAVAKLTSIHLRGQLRASPQDNFGSINPECDFCTIELWKQLEPDLKWRIEKPGRVIVMDGESTVHYIKPPSNEAYRLPERTRAAFDTGWLHQIANLSLTITNDLKHALAQGWPLLLKEEKGADGRPKSVVSVQTKSSLPQDDYLRNKFVEDSDTRRVYRFDAQSELLESVQVYLLTSAGEVLIFDLTQIECNQPIDPAVFQLDLPANVRWDTDKWEKLPDNEKYAAMTAQQAARAYFEACGRMDWAEAQKFEKSTLDERSKEYLGGIELISLGEPFGSKGYDPDGRFVPYEIKLKDGSVKKWNLALKKDQDTGRWFVDGGI